MNWHAIKSLRSERLGAFLALMILAWSPFSGGPRVPCLLLAILGVWWIWKRRQQVFSNPAVKDWLWIFLLLWVPVVLSIPGSFNPRSSWSVAAVLPLYFLTGIGLIYSLRSQMERRWLAKWLAIILAIWIIDALIQYSFGKDLLGIPLWVEDRVVGFFGSNLRLPLFLSIFLPILLLPLLDRHIAWLLVLSLLTSWIVVLGGARMNLVILVIVIVGIYGHLQTRFKLATLAIILIMLMAMASFSSVTHERFARFAELKKLDYQTINYALSNRLYIWESAGHMFLDRPLTGVGVNSFEEAYDHYATRPQDPLRLQADNTRLERAYHAHQMYISIAAETGLFGLVGIAGIFILLIRKYFQATPVARKAAWPYGLCLFAATFPLNSQPVLYTHWWFPILLLLLCAMLSALAEAHGSAKIAKTTV